MAAHDDAAVLAARNARFAAASPELPVRHKAHPETLVVKDLDATRMRFFERCITKGIGLNATAQGQFEAMFGEGAYERAMEARSMPKREVASALVSSESGHKSPECSPSTKTCPPSPE
jgi:hypothetical protein